MARSVRIFLRLAGILIALILLLAGALIFLATTATGLSLTTKALDRWVPGLSIEKSDGDWRHLTLTGIGWTSPGVDVKAEKRVIELDWYRLFDKKLKLGRLEIDRPEALVETAKLPQQEAVPEESAPFELPDLKLPIGITLEGIAARDAKAVINGETIELKSLDAELDLHDGILKLSKFSLAGISSGLGRIPAGAAQFDAAARMSREGVVIEEAALSEGHADLSNLSSPALASEEAQPAGEASTSASVLVPAPASLPLAPSHQTYLERVKGIFAEPFIKTLPVVKLPFDAQLRSLKASGIRLEGIPGTEGLPGLSPLEIRTIDAKASMKASHVEIERFQLESSAADLALSGSADLDGAWPVNLSLEVRADAAPWGTLVGLRFDSPEAEFKTTLSGEIAGALHLEAMTKGPVAMTLKAAANPGEADLPFSLSLASDEIKSPEILAASSEKAETAGSDAAPQVSGTPPAASEKTPLNEEASSRPGIAGTFAKSRYIVRNLALEAAGRPSAWELALKGNPVIEAPDALLGRETRFEGTLERVTRHGVLVEISGEGILINGDSGIGKSETAIELVKRGHRLIADDAVEIRKVSSRQLVGNAPEGLRHYIELRGIGVINVAKLFGMGAVKDSCNIDLIINMVPWRDGEAYDRLGIETQYTEILDVKVPSITIPITPGRNLAVIFEVAAINNRQKRMGYNAAMEFTEQMSKFFANKDD